MAAHSSPTLFDLFRATPIQTALLTLTPVALAVGQLANSLLTDFSPAIAVGFAAVMVGFSVVATGHHAAEVRLDRLERAVQQSDGRHDRATTAERP